jgi:hypothetical protein
VASRTTLVTAQLFEPLGAAGHDHQIRAALARQLTSKLTTEAGRSARYQHPASAKIHLLHTGNLELRGHIGVGGRPCQRDRAGLKPCGT